MLCLTDLTKVGLITIAASSVCTSWQINFRKNLIFLIIFANRSFHYIQISYYLTFSSLSKGESLPRMDLSGKNDCL